MDWFKECPNCHNRVLRSLDVCNFCGYIFNKGFTMKKILILVMLMASWCFGATTWYVNPDSGNDAAAGSEAAPLKTLKHAIDSHVSADGDIIKLMAGTYDDTSQGSAWTVTIPDYSFTVEPYVAGTTVTLTRATATAGGWFRYYEVDRSDKTCTFNDIVFVDSKSAGSIVQLYNTSASGNVVFDGCTFTVAADGWVYTATHNRATKDLLRDAKFINCTFTAQAAQSTVPFSFRGGHILFSGCAITNSNAGTTGTISVYAGGECDQITLLNNTITFANASGTSIGFQLSGVVVREGVVVKGNTFHHTTTNQAATAIYLVYSDVYSIYNVLIDDNIITSDNTTSTSSVGIGFTDKVYNTIVTNNTLTGWGIDFNIQNGKNGTYEYNIASGYVVFANYGARGLLIKNNTFIAANRGASTDGKCLMLARSNQSTEVAKANATFTANTGISSAAWDLSVIAADTDGLTNGDYFAIVYDPTAGSPDPDYYGIVTAVDNDTDTVTVDYWRDRSEVAATPTNAENYIRLVKWAENCTVTKNIFDAGSGQNTFTFDFNPRSGQTYSNYNCYVSGATSIMNLDSTVQATLAAVQAKWLTFSRSFYDNDSHSIVESPAFISSTNLRPTNAHLRVGSNSYMGAYRPTENKPMLNH